MLYRPHSQLKEKKLPTLELVFAKSKYYADKEVCVICECSDSGLPKPQNGEHNSLMSVNGWQGRSPSEMIAKAMQLGWSEYRQVIDPIQAQAYGELYLYSVYFDKFGP